MLPPVPRTPPRKRRPSSSSIAGTPPRGEGASSKVKIPRKVFNLVWSIFREHDKDGDGFISEDEFAQAVGRAGQDDGRPYKVRPSTGVSLGQHSRDIYDRIMSRERLVHGGISLIQFVHLYFPHLSRAEVERTCHHYTYVAPPPPPQQKTLEDVEGARDEIEAIFRKLDGDNDGLVRVKSLEPMFLRTGLRSSDVQEWLKEIGLQGSHATDAQKKMERLKSKLDLQDMEKLLGPVYIGSAEGRQQSLDQIQRSIDWNRDLALDVIYAT